MKIVINKCFGGFSLSPLAVKELAKRKGRECYFFKQDIRAGLSSPYIPISLEEAAKEFMWHAFSVENPNDKIGRDDNWHEMTAEQRKAHNEAWEAISLESRPDNRADPDLIAVVEKLGEKAGGSCADLKIVEIPDDADWEIDEYDGLEHIAEKHRTWA